MCLQTMKNEYNRWVWLTKSQYCVVLNYAPHIIQSGSDPDNFKVGLTQTKHDLDNPTQFQCCCLLAGLAHY